MSDDTPQPEQSGDEFLSAPDSLTQSEEELRKAQVRKARELAEEQQLRSRKACDEDGNLIVPSVEDMIADVQRVAQDPTTNPLGFRFSTISRKRYREFGHYDISFVDERFGQFTHFLEVANLRDARGTREKKAATAEKSRREHRERYLSRYVRPYVREGEHSLRSTELVLSISDTHATFLDRFTWACFLQACRDLEPDTIVLNGDILEGAEISRHPKIPGWTVPLQLEFDFAHEMFRQLRAVAPDAEIIWTAGNHGLDRLAAYLSQVAPALAGLRNLRFDKLAGIDDLGIVLAQGGSISSPEGTEDDSKGVLLHGFYRIHHGHRLGKNPAIMELGDAMRSGQSGHVHRANVAYGTTETLAGLSWMTTPMGCHPVAGRSYMKGTTTGWQRGFGVAFLSPGDRVHQYPVVTEGGRCVVEGFEYTDPGYQQPDPKALWLPGLAGELL